MVMREPLSTLIGVRAEHNDKARPRYDRVVFEFRGSIPRLEVEYVPQLVRGRSGSVVPLAGSAIVQVRFHAAHVYNDQGDLAAPARLTFHLPNVKEVARAGGSDDVVTYGIGVDHQARLRILSMTDPSRVVIDFLH